MVLSGATVYIDIDRVAIKYMKNIFSVEVQTPTIH